MACSPRPAAAEEPFTEDRCLESPTSPCSLLRSQLLSFQSQIPHMPACLLSNQRSLCTNWRQSSSSRAGFDGSVPACSLCEGQETNVDQRYKASDTLHNNRTTCDDEFSSLCNNTNSLIIVVVKDRMGQQSTPQNSPDLDPGCHRSLRTPAGDFECLSEGTEGRGW
ncbi:hypothetical protein NQZ68_035603 [Dissostichus eleginoides]|nr:hypothetical protein NQZ68_035603 [Dissostichus eleginoides]